MSFKRRMSVKFAIEVVACVLGILLASWSGPTVRNAIAPQIRTVCPICGWGPNEPRSP